MDKELDPLRELDSGAKKEDSPPTVELSADDKRLSPDTRDPEKSNSGKSAAARAGAPTPSRQPTIQQTSLSHTRLRYGGHAVSIRENIAPREHIRLYGNVAPTLTLFTLGIIVAMLGIGVYKGMTSPVTLPGGISTVGMTDLSAFPESLASIEPLFGAYATRRCTDRCESHNSPTREQCQRGCSIHQISIYGRRISFDKYDPISDMSEILNRCAKRESALETHTSGSAWSEDIAGSVDVLGDGPEILRAADISRTRAYYSRLLQSSQYLRLPPGGTPGELTLTREIAQANCLSANLALTTVALLSSQQAADEVSARYYRDLSQALEPKVLELNTRVMAGAKNLKLR